MPNVLSRNGAFTLVERRSRFEARSARCASVEEAAAFLELCASDMPAASHHVFAWRIGPGLERCSDAGEPQGSAGRPCLGLLQAMDLIEAVVVVSRVFGGIKLGYGGLTRAYRGSAHEALLDGLPTPWTMPYATAFTFSHAEWARVAALLSGFPFRADCTFAAEVTLHASGPREAIAAFAKIARERLQRPLDLD